MQCEITRFALLSIASILPALILPYLYDLDYIYYKITLLLKRVATKIRGNTTTKTNTEVMLIQTSMCEVIEHVQFNFFRVLGHENACEN